MLDDELPGLAYLKMMCEAIPELDIVKTYIDPEKFMAEMAGINFDLCITDIEMPGTDGLELVGLMRDKLIIFITAYKDYAADAFEAEAIDYITKPYTKERLQKAVSKAAKELNSRSAIAHMQLNTDKGKAMIYFDKIAYIRTADIDSRDKEVLLLDGHRLLLKNINFNALLMLLPKASFARINKKAIISLKAIKFYSQHEVIIHDANKNGMQARMPLSETYRQDFLLRVQI